MSQSPTTNFQETPENQWTQEPTNNVHQNGMHLQWRDIPLPDMVPASVANTLSASDMVPAPVADTLSASAYSPTLPQQKQFFFPNNANNMNNYGNRNITNGNQVNTNTLHLPNGMEAVTRNSTNGTLLGNPNGVVTNASNGWVMSAQNSGRFLTRPVWNPATKTTGVRKSKRIRTGFTSQQMRELEQEYARARYLDRTRRIELAETLHLNERTIKIWFQNRRMKEKKDEAESLEEEGEATSTPDSSSEYFPVVMQDELNGQVYSRNVYVEEQPGTSTGMLTSMPMSQIAMMNGYSPAFTSEGSNQVDQCRQQVHSQSHPPPPYSSELQTIVEDSPPSLEEAAPAPPAKATADQNWDCSWIRSIDDDC